MKIPGLVGLGLGFCLMVLTGCQTATGPRFDPRQPKAAPLSDVTTLDQTNRIDPAWLKAPSDPFTLGPGDRVEIEIVGNPQSRTTVTIGPDGKIYYDLLPGLDVWGLTLEGARSRIESEMGKLEVNPPPISLTLRGIESRRVWLLGRLQNAGVYPIANPTTVLDAVAQAGGSFNVPGSSEEIADLRHSFIIRNGQLLPVDLYRLLRDGDMSQNIYLQPGDFVYFPSAKTGDVHVLGAVRIPKAVNYAHDTTVVSAIAAAGGTIKDAYLSHVAIVRGSLAEPKIAIVDYKEIIQGKIPDIRLDPQDILYVPFTPYRTLTRYADLILTTFVRAVAINEGARAGSDNAVPVGVNIGIGTATVSP